MHEFNFNFNFKFNFLPWAAWSNHFEKSEHDEQKKTRIRNTAYFSVFVNIVYSTNLSSGAHEQVVVQHRY